jgi:N-ethylmaleimide reductase
MSKLFTPAKIGPYRFSHRVVLAPMTRLRSDRIDTPLPMMADFYGQRASEAGFLIAECVQCGLRGPARSMPCS